MNPLEGKERRRSTNSVSLVLIDLVDRDDELNVGRLLDEFDDFSTLRHDSIVRCDDENDDIRDLGSSSSHSGEGGVSWGVEEANRSRLG